MIKANELREKFLAFYEKRRHARIPASPLVPENDPTTLFTSSGMQPLVAYLLGEKHPSGTRLTNSQPCFRSGDIEEVGDNRHTTFFEMLGNWSLGDYFKKEQLEWFFEFLTKVVGLDPKRLYVSVFEGGNLIPRDEESIKIWQELFKTRNLAQEGNQGFDPRIKIYSYDATKNWWSRPGSPDDMPPGEPGGPDSEVFFDFGADLKLHEKSPFAKQPCHINCDCGRFLEIGNSVFMEYQKNAKGDFDRLAQKNVDFGGGLERILTASANEPDIFKSEVFWPLIETVERESSLRYAPHKLSMQIIVDHLKAATFMISQGVEPSNKLQGYILRRLLRRAAVKMYLLKGELSSISGLEKVSYQVLKIYEGIYFQQLKFLKKRISTVITQEMSRFAKTLNRGLKIIKEAKSQVVNSQFAFNLFQTYGFPFEVTQELLAAKGTRLNQADFEAEFRKHQQKSRTATKGMFQGGLANSSPEIIKLHTATHLLHQALREVLGRQVKQEGSNITTQRLRFDFTTQDKPTDQQLKKVEEIVNEKIRQNLPVEMEVMDLRKAQKAGALAFFRERYGRRVKVYSVGDFSCEVCGGPHVKNTKEIGHVKIRKEESIGAGRRRIYASLEKLPDGS